MKYVPIEKTRWIQRILNKRTDNSHYDWTKKWGAGQEPKIQIAMTELTEDRRTLYQALDLGRYRTA
jgi:hypothetical protein